MITSIDLIESWLLDSLAKLEILGSPNGGIWSRLKEAEQSFCVFPVLAKQADIPTNLAIQVVNALPVPGKIDCAEVAVQVSFRVFVQLNLDKSYYK